jgi:hypothetical protein
MGWPDGWTFSQKWMDRLLAEDQTRHNRNESLPQLEKLQP